MPCQLGTLVLDDTTNPQNVPENRMVFDDQNVCLQSRIGKAYA